MNNWNYGGSIPTSPWRSAMTVPRELSLKPVAGALQLVQNPVQQLNQLTTGPVVHLENQTIPQGTTPLPASGEAVKIDATLGGGSADQYGLKVRTGNGQETVIGYDRAGGDLYIDRSKSGDVSFDPSFTGLQQAPLPAPDGVVHLTVLVDWSSVEVFAQDGQVLMTDQIFPNPTSTGIAAFATGGTAQLQSITIHGMRSAWTQKDEKCEAGR
jgi:levanase